MGDATDLRDAAERHDLGRLVALLASGADPNGPLADRPYWPPLKVAVDELRDGGPLDAVVHLLRHRAAPDGGRVDGGWTPLHVAAVLSHTEAARLLIAAGADATARGDEGATPLQVAVAERNYDLARLLLAAGATATLHDWGAGGAYGMNALARAAHNLDLPMIELLLAAGADPTREVDYWLPHQYLPQREESDPAVWDRAAGLLGR